MTTLLSLSLSGSIFIVILLLCKPLYRKRLSKRWQYYVYLIVIMRLLIPVSLDISGKDSEKQMTVPDISDVQIDNPYTEINLPEIQAAEVYPHTHIINTVLSSLWLVWLVVAVALFVHKITIYQSFARYIKIGCIEVSDIEILEQFGNIAEQANIKRGVEIYTNRLISSPLLIGFFRPYIVFPALNISESDFRHTILHELTHYKRGDMFYKWLVQLTICLHWFNPLVHFMGREINNACEFSCDESVIKNMDYSEIKAYGNTLLNAMRAGGKFKNSLSFVTLNANKKILEERLDMIKNFKKKPRFTVIATLLITILISMGAAVTGAYATTNSTSAENDGNTARTNPNEKLKNITAADSRRTVEIDIPHIYTTNLFVPHNPLYIESLLVNPGDVITFDLSADIGSPYVGLSAEMFTDPAGHWVNIGNTGVITVDGTQPQYVFVFVQANIAEPAATSLSGIIAIESASNEILAQDAK